MENTLLVGIDELNEIMEQFFIELGYDEIECCLETDFCYYLGTDEIAYSLVSMENADKGFKKFLENTYENIPPCSLFVISLLHELGHHITLPLYSKKIKKEWSIKKSLVESKKADTDEEKIQKQIEYCNLPEEKIATDKAIEILLENYKFIHSYEKTIFKAIKNFYKKNNITA